MGDTLAPGTTLAGGRYRIDELLDSGGMAHVYRAYDVRLERQVAIKTMQPKIALELESVRRFQRESQAMAALGHPHVVTVHDTGEEVRTEGEPMPYFVMELVKGNSLAAELRARGKLPASQAVPLADQILSALEASHALDLVHRDIKPANVLLAPGGIAKVADFGIVRALDQTATALTRPSFMLGTPEYMAPEQIRGEPDLDSRCDLYAVGILLFEILTGSRPFNGPGRDSIARQHQYAPPPTLESRGITGQPGLEMVLARALAKEPDDRYPDAKAMRRALRAAVTAPAPPPLPPRPGPAPGPGPTWGLGPAGPGPTLGLAPTGPAPTLIAPGTGAPGSTRTSRRPGGGVADRQPAQPLPRHKLVVHGVRLALCALLLVVALWYAGEVSGFTNVGNWSEARWTAFAGTAASAVGLLGSLPVWRPDKKGPTSFIQVISWLLAVAQLLSLLYGCLSLVVLKDQKGCTQNWAGTRCEIQ
ncbi:serine/threonine-protein kinase [Streptomyces sp. NPDC026092]|uniref:serine/threonine-protein kinase n=1 Tax=Streptomyces sp. NPDC026092 TaxID=3154797 RepID=UPI003405EC02